MHASVNDVLDSDHRDFFMFPGEDSYPSLSTWDLGHGQIVYVILDYAYDDRLSAYFACLIMYQSEAYVYIYSNLICFSSS